MKYNLSDWYNKSKLSSSKLNGVKDEKKRIQPIKRRDYLANGIQRKVLDFNVIDSL